MGTKRFIDNPLLKKFDRVAVPLTDLNDGKDYQAGVDELVKIVLKGGRLENYWDMQADVLPTCHSFSDPEYLTAGTWFFEDISNTEQKPDKLAGKTVQFARLLCEAGRSETEGLNFVKQYLFYVNMTDQELELSMRGVLLNGGGEVQGATPWKTGVDQADTAKEAAHAVNADNATEAAHAVNADNATNATNADNATNATTAGTATNAGYAGNSAMLGGVAASKYALKKDIPAGLSEQAILDISHPLDSFYPAGADEKPMQLFNGENYSSWWNEVPAGSKKWQRVKQEDFQIPQITELGKGRNLITVLGASSIQDAFAKLRQRVINRDYSGLLLGDYLDLASINTGSRSGAGVINNNTSWQNLRVEIYGSDFYDYGGKLSNHGILFGFKNIVYKHRMNSTDTNAGGYISSELYPIVNEDFAAGLTEVIGFAPKEIHRTIDKGYGSSSSNWTTEKVFLPTEMEYFGEKGDDAGNHYGMRPTPQHVNLQNIQQYPIFAKRGNNAGRVKKFEGGSGYPWEASSYKDGAALFAYVSDDGGASDHRASSTGYGVSPAFYIG